MDEKRSIITFVEILAEKYEYKQKIIDILKSKLNNFQQIVKKRIIFVFDFLLNRIRTYISNFDIIKNNMRKYNVQIISRCN